VFLNISVFVNATVSVVVF